MKTRRQRWNLGLARALVLGLLALLVVGAAPTAGADPDSLLWDDDGASFARFGPNRSVTIAFGRVAFACDAFFPTADVYVVSGTPGNGATLTDVSGGVNTVFGATGGLFTATIGFTKPGGNLGPGRYTVVYDECQNGKLESIDSVFPDAFEVAIPTDVPPADPAIAAIKADATRQAARWQEYLDNYELLEKLEKYEVVLACLAGGAAVCGAEILADLIEDAMHPFEELKDRGKDAINDGLKSWKGLAADPPDPAFGQRTRLAAVEQLDPESHDALVRAEFAVSNAAATEGALVDALVAAVERYQGADRAGDGTWSLAHARDIAAFATTLRSHLSASSAALNGLADTLAADTRDFDRLAGYLGSELERIEGSGFDGAQVGMLRSLDSVGSLSAKLGAAASEDVAVAGFTEARLADAIDALVASNEASIVSLQELAANATTLATALETDAAVIRRLPTANAGGPYTAAEGRPLTLAGSAAHPEARELTAAWDLDGDGQFDDATGLAPSVTLQKAVAGVIGLRVADDRSNEAFSYAAVTVSDADAAPAVTSLSPDAGAVDVTVGSARTFTVTANDPESAPLAIDWTLDGAAAGSGPSFGYPAAAADVGPHALEARISDGSAAVRVRWTLLVAFADADGDKWAADVDCDDANANVNPGRFEIPGNDLDDDCNPATPDSKLPGLTLLESLVVPVTLGSSVTSTTTLAQDVTYRLRASGTFFIGGPGFADAEYAFNTSFSQVLDHCFNSPDATDLGIAVNDPLQTRLVRKQPVWGSFQQSHVYTTDFVGLGAPIMLNYHDCGHADNSGSLKVEIFLPDPPPNATPEVQAGPDQAALTGAVVTLPPAAFTDDGGAHAARVDWGDGTLDEAAAAGSETAGTVAGSHVYGESGTYTVTVSVTDSEGATGTDTALVTVSKANAPPRLAPLGDVSMREGERLTVPVFAIDPEGDAVTLTATGVPSDASFTDRGSGGGSFELAPTDDAAATIQLSACDAGSCTSDTFALTALNVAPLAAASNDGPVDVGAAVSISAAAADPGTDTFELAFDCDGDGTFGPFAAASTTTCSFARAGRFDVGVRVRDDDGGTGTAATAVEVGVLDRRRRRRRRFRHRRQLPVGRESRPGRLRLRRQRRRLRRPLRFQRRVRRNRRRHDHGPQAPLHPQRPVQAGRPVGQRHVSRQGRRQAAQGSGRDGRRLQGLQVLDRRHGRRWWRHGRLPGHRRGQRRAWFGRRLPDQLVGQRHVRRRRPADRRQRRAALSGGTEGARAPGPLLRPVERLVDELVGELVVLAPDRGVGDRAELAGQAGGPQRELAQRLVLDLVLAAHLLDHQLRVGDHLELADVELDRLLEPGDQGAVLGDVVRRDADRLAVGREHRAVLGLEHVAVGRRPGIPARAAVGEELRPHTTVRRGLGLNTSRSLATAISCTAVVRRRLGSKHKASPFGTVSSTSARLRRRSPVFDLADQQDSAPSSDGAVLDAARVRRAELDSRSR